MLPTPEPLHKPMSSSSLGCKSFGGWCKPRCRPSLSTIRVAPADRGADAGMDNAELVVAKDVGDRCPLAKRGLYFVHQTALLSSLTLILGVCLSVRPESS
jgi:hypothetical protein